MRSEDCAGREGRGIEMNYEINDTTDYHVHGLDTLGWELTVCNALDPEGSPCRGVLRRNQSYGRHLYDYLGRFIRMPLVRRMIEIGGGYGYLMRDFLNRNPDLQAAMLDVSPRLLQKQRQTLRQADVRFIEADVMDVPGRELQGYDLAVLNENLGDLPTLVDVPRNVLVSDIEIPDPVLEQARTLFHRYAIDLPEDERVNINIGALKVLEKLCCAGVPFIFMSEHSCEVRTPEPLQRYIQRRPTGNPERIRLRGHDEFTIRFSDLETLARVFSYRIARGPFADFLEFDFTDRLRYIMAAKSSRTDEHEIVRHFIEDLYQYEYLILMKEGGSCRRCGKCCLADFCAYITPEDMKRWHDEGRQDILTIIERERAVWMGDHLISSADGHYLRGCPFLAWEGDHSSCAIHATRPRTCRDYRPGSSEICPQFKP